MSPIEILGWPMRHLLLELHDIGLPWIACVLIAATIVRTLLLPIGWYRWRSSMVLAAISPRLVEMHLAHKDDPKTYESAFVDIYRANRVSPLSTTGWFMAFLGIVIFSMIGVGQSRFDISPSESLLGASILSPAIVSWTGRAVLALEICAILYSLYSARAAFASSNRYLRWSFYLLTVVVMILVGSLASIYILLYLAGMIGLSLIEHRVLGWWGRRRQTPGEPLFAVYDEHGDPLTATGTA